MKNAKKFTILLLIAVCVCALCGCNDDATDDSSEETAIYSREVYTIMALERAMGYEIAQPTIKAATSFYICYFHPTMPSSITYDVFDEQADYYYTALQSAPTKTVGIYGRKTANEYVYEEGDSNNPFRTVYYIAETNKQAQTVEGISNAYMYWTASYATYYYSFDLGDMSYVISMAGTNQWEDNAGYFSNIAVSMIPQEEE